MGSSPVLRSQAGGRPAEPGRSPALSRACRADPRFSLVHQSRRVRPGARVGAGRHLGVKHCIAVCNATIGLEIAIRAMPMSGEVIVPSMTFRRHAALAPVAADHAGLLRYRPGDLRPARPGAVEELITEHTTGILGVHVWGRPCAVRGARGDRGRHRLHLLFDAAHAFGCSHGGRMIGSFGAPRSSASTRPSSSTPSKAARSPPTTTSWRTRSG